jgi:hypothetical protein
LFVLFIYLHAGPHVHVGFCGEELDEFLAARDLLRCAGDGQRPETFFLGVFLGEKEKKERISSQLKSYLKIQFLMSISERKEYSWKAS